MPLSNMIRRYLILPALLWLPVQTAWAVDVPFEFATAQQSEQYQQLIEEIRCLVCQNQSLADSNADLAQDLRNEIYQMIQSGKSDQEIIDFLVARYGDFVLYRPPLKGSTILLWSAPFILAVLALTVVLLVVRGRKQAQQSVVTDEERKRLAQLLDNK